MDDRFEFERGGSRGTMQDVRSLAGLLGDALSQFSKLFQTEIDLAKAEIGEKTRQICTAAALFACGAVLVIPALVMALFALSAALIAAGWSAAGAYLISALIAALLAGILFAIGLRKLDADNLRPSQTLAQLEKDKQAIKGFAR